MADTPKKTSGTTRKAPPTGGKGVALTARQALQAADLATAAPAPVRKTSAPGKPVAKAPAAKARVAKSAPVEKSVAKSTLAKAAVPAVPSAPPTLKKALNDVQTQLVQPVVDKVKDVITPLIETAPQVETTVHTAIAEGKTTMNDVIANTKKYTEEAKTRFQSAFADMNEKAKVNVEKSTKAIEEITELTKGNVEALVESGKIAAKGLEAMGQDAAEYSRLTFEKASATMKSLAAAKSPTEFFQLQSDLLSSAFDVFAKESAKTSEAIIKLAGDVAQPLSSRVSVVTEKVKSLAA